MAEESQNALLKTLEEPPGYAHLILITAEPAALLETVRSRLHRGPLRAAAARQSLRAPPRRRPSRPRTRRSSPHWRRWPAATSAAPGCSARRPAVGSATTPKRPPGRRSPASSPAPALGRPDRARRRERQAARRLPSATAAARARRRVRQGPRRRPGPARGRRCRQARRPARPDRRDRSRPRARRHLVRRRRRGRRGRRPTSSATSTAPSSSRADATRARSARRPQGRRARDGHPAAPSGQRQRGPRARRALPPRSRRCCAGPTPSLGRRRKRGRWPPPRHLRPSPVPPELPVTGRSSGDPADPQAAPVRRPPLARPDVLGDRDPDRRDRLHRRRRIERGRGREPHRRPRGRPDAARPREGRAGAPGRADDEGERTRRRPQGDATVGGLPDLALQQPAGRAAPKLVSPETVAGLSIATVRGRAERGRDGARRRPLRQLRPAREPDDGRGPARRRQGTSRASCCRSPSGPRRSSRPCRRWPASG